MKGKKVLLSIIVIIILGGIATGCWYFSTKYKDKEEQKIEEKNDVVVKYNIEKYERSTNNKGLIINNNLVIPSSISVDNGTKIVDYIRNVLEKDWEDVKEQTDFAIETYDPDFQFDDQYGITYTTDHYINNDLIVFNVVTSGSMGGVGWDETRYYNFDLTTGELLKVEDICKNVKACKEFMNDEFNRLLKEDQRYKYLDEGFEDVVKEQIFLEGNYGFTKEGFVLIVPEYKISDGASGAFIYTISYLELDNYLKDEYKI